MTNSAGSRRAARSIREFLDGVDVVLV